MKNPCSLRLSATTAWLISSCFLLAIACKGPEPPAPQPEDNLPPMVLCEENFTPKGHPHQVIGFYPSYRETSLPLADLRWDHLSRIVYAFALPRTNGTLDVGALGGADALIEAAHQEGVEVYLSIGGGGNSENFPVMARDSAARKRFAREVQRYLGTHCFDGVDVDWESWTKDANNQPSQEESESLVALLRDLKTELAPHQMGITIDVFASDWFGRHYLDEVVDLVDEVQIMAYDFSGSWSAPGPHSSFEQAIGTGSVKTGLKYWEETRGWSKEKLILGLPFYGRDFDNNGGGITYADILALHPQAFTADQVANIYFNGRATIADKCEYIRDGSYPGVMIWELGQDTRETQTSLLTVVDSVLNP
ncbi:MAG: glycosyl hydrolase family 18 protein [Bacteroidota bacterium]